MKSTAKVICDSVAENGIRITTMELRYWRAIHAEFMTHRVFSRNASSSRAIPVKKILSQVWNDPAGPEHWGKNQPGMQARGEISRVKQAIAKFLWFKVAARIACILAWFLVQLGLHKQVANRLLEPWQYITVVVTATDWGNFFHLRLSKDAQPEIFTLARAMHFAMKQSIPRKLSDVLWHLPYIRNEDFGLMRKYLKEMLGHIPLPELVTKYMCMVSAARCARVSYLNHDGSSPDIIKDLDLYSRLADRDDIHASPMEHQAKPDIRVPDELHYAWEHGHLHGNLSGWIQFRKTLPNETRSFVL